MLATTYARRLRYCRSSKKEKRSRTCTLKMHVDVHPFFKIRTFIATDVYSSL